MSDLRALEHSTLKVPYEILNKKFRAAQKTVDREISHVQHAAKQLDSVLQGETVRISDAQAAVALLQERLLAFMERTSLSIADETEASVALKKRIEHLKVATSTLSSLTAVEQWKKVRIDRLLVEYLLRSGYYESASELAKSCGIEYMSNLGVFLSAKEVEDSLSAHQVEKCLEWCADNKSKLRRLRSVLELRVREQEFIEMIRRGERLRGVEYSRKYFAPVKETEQWAELEQILGLLAFSPDTPIPAYRHLFSETRWGDLIGLFREENYRLYQLAHQSVFSACLQTGISALKTPECGQESSRGTRPKSRGIRECPVCLPDVRALAAPLQYAHSSQSRLVCYISGEPLNENNPPLMLPNGMVYGASALEALAASGEGRVTCPRTGMTFEAHEALRVYVM